MTDKGPGTPVRHNDITDIAGIRVGHYTELVQGCGTTVVLLEEPAVAGVDVRGSAPGTRETDLLSPLNLVQEVDAVVLSGGSVYGLEAAEGVVRFLEEKGRGFRVDETHRVPIVPAAVLFDLGRGKRWRPEISAQWGYRACINSSTGPVALGNVGAGTGAVSGGLKGGIGSASILLDEGLMVAAIVAVNSYGSAVDPETGYLYAGYLELEGEFRGAGSREAPRAPAPPSPPGGAGQGTTIGVVATDGSLSRVQVTKVAQMAQDGIARALRPSHTMFDGDTIFALATCRKPLPQKKGFFTYGSEAAINEIGAAAADAISRAIVKGILHAETLGPYPAYKDRFGLQKE